MTQLQIISSDIGFAAFGVGGRAVIDVALLTSQVSHSPSFLLSPPIVCTSDWLLLCLPHLYIREPRDLYTCELNYFYLNIIQFELMYLL